LAWKMKLLICLFAVLAVAQKQPTFSNNWYSTLDEDAAVFQGDYSFIPAMGYCCSEESNCQVQVEYINSTFYQDYTNNRTRQDAIDMDQTIITDFTIMKEMLVDPTSMDCLEYCPTDGETLTPGFLAPNSTDLGPTVIDGVKVEEWMYQQKPLGPKTKWVVETSYVFVNQAPNPAVPVQENDILTPFGFEIGAANMYWSDFVSQMPKASLFNVNNVNSCPMSNGCNDDTSILGQRRHRNRPRHHQTFRNSAAVRAAAAPEQAHAKKVVPPLPRKPKHAPVSVVKGQKPVQSSQPVFPNDWTAFQEDWEVQYQGDFTQSSEMYCCQLNSNCNIETGYDRGMFYFDFTNNRTRFDDEYAGTVEIVDFTAQMDMMVDPTNLTCLNYCPLLGETLEPGFLEFYVCLLGHGSERCVRGPEPKSACASAGN